MAQKLNPFSGRQFIDANGDPYSGAQLFAYVAGSSSKTTLTKDSAGTSNHTNPITLNSRGEPADAGGASQAMWQAEGVSVKLVLAPSTDTDPPASPISTWDSLNGINDTTTTADQWVLGPSPTYVSGTQFTLVGDQTTEFHVGRRVKIVDAGGAIYGLITASAYTTLTTVTVSLDSGSLTNPLSTVSYGLLSSDNPSVPGDLQHIRHLAVSGNARLSKGSDVASASALMLGTDGNYFDITGTTAITSIDTIGVGAVVKFHFDDSLILTHSATSLMLPGGADITTAAGDEAEFVEYSVGNWRCTNYTRASGEALYQLPGSSVQTQYTQTGAHSTGTTTIPLDDTIPQNTEGFEVMTVSITPTKSTNILVIEILVQMSHSVGNNNLTIALFQDSVSNAISVSTQEETNNGVASSVPLSHIMVAGTTSSTTFKVRIGSSYTGTVTFNGKNGSRYYGGIFNSYIKVTEYES